MTDKMPRTYTVAGTSMFNGIKTFRVANGNLKARKAVYKYYGHDEILLEKLPHPMTKVEAVAYMIGKGVDAMVPTRAKDKHAKTAIQHAAEALAAKQKAESAQATKSDFVARMAAARVAAKAKREAAEQAAEVA